MKPFPLISTVLVIAVFLKACGIWIPGEITWETQPDADGGILSAGEYPGITFSEGVNRDETAGALDLAGPNGSIPGESQWQKETLTFIPHRPLPPGIEWTLTLETILKGKSGRTTPISLSRRFFSVREEKPLELTLFTPAPGETAGAETPVTLTFSRPVSRESLRQAWNIRPSPDGGCRFSWQKEDREVIIIPENRWKNQEIHRWELTPGTEPDGLTDTDGCPLTQPEEGLLAVQEERERPRLLSWEPVTPDGTPQGEFTPDSALELTFSQELDRSSLERGITWTPTGEAYWRYPESGVLRLCPQTPWPGNSPMELTLSTALTNWAGTPFDPENGTSEERTITLPSSIPPLKIEELRWMGSGTEAVFGPEDYNQILSTPRLEPLTSSGGLRLTFRFSHAVQPGYQETLPRAVSLEAWLPESLAPPQTQSWGWNDPYTLFIHFTGITSPPPPSSDPDSPPPPSHWYRLTVRRDSAAYGPQGQLEEDLWLILQS